jgi:hypothetical protein
MAKGDPIRSLLQSPKLKPDSEIGAAMLNRLNRGIEDLNAVAEFLLE